MHRQMQAAMRTLTTTPIQLEYPKVLPLVSPCRLDPLRIALTSAQPCFLRRKMMEQCYIEKTGANGLVLHSSVLKIGYKVGFAKGLFHTAELGKVWAVSRSSEDYHVEKPSSMGDDISMQHDNFGKAEDNAMFVKDIQHAVNNDNPSDSHDMIKAQSGLALALCNSGLSQEDSDLIASKAPITVRSLVNAALELDEFAVWIDQQPTKQKDLKQKVIEFATTNVNRQLGAIVESIGVGERHISRVCHFLASQSTADVLQKVRVLEDVFPNEKNEVIVARTRRMMREMSLSADAGLQKTLSLFEKMEAKRGGISTLTIPRDALPYVIEEFPQVLVRNLGPDLEALANYFEEIGVPKESIASVYMCFPSILLYRSIEELQSRLRTLRKVTSVRPRNFGMMVVKYPWILSRCVEDNVKPVADFLLSAKVPPGKVGQCITRCPNLLGSSTMSLQTMLEQLKLTGVNSRKIGNILTHYPQLLLKTQRSFLEIVNFLQGFGLEESTIPKILVRCPPVFASTKPLLRKKITFLQQLGIRNQRLTCVLQRYPEVLMLSVENSLNPRLMFFKSMGLSNEDIGFMICGFPPLLGYSIESVLRPKFDALQNVLHQPVKEVVSYPRYFSYCLEKKILPRYRILKRSSVEWDLKSMLSTNDDQFAQDHLGFERMLVPPV